MFWKLILAMSLMATCVAVHAFGLTTAIRALVRRRDRDPARRHATMIFIELAGWIIALHLLEIGLWALAYDACGLMQDFSTAMYFSTVTYTTTGYGDVVLPPARRVIGGIEALTGILMCGWSAAFFFAVFIRIYDPDLRSR